MVPKKNGYVDIGTLVLSLVSCLPPVVLMYSVCGNLFRPFCRPVVRRSTTYIAGYYIRSSGSDAGVLQLYTTYV